MFSLGGINMAKKINVILTNKIVKWLIIPLCLFGLWFILTLWNIIVFHQSFLIVSYSHSSDNFTQLTNDKLLKGEKITGEFIAQEPNLGIVGIRFKSFQRVAYKDEDALVFRLKEKSQKDWYYENTYRSGFIYDLPFLPLGFPLISDSKGKTYVFELQSLKGNEKNGVALSTREPILESKYQADKAELVASPITLLAFGAKKFFNSFDNIDIVYSSLLFSLPLVFYLLWLFPFAKRLHKQTLQKLKKHKVKNGVVITTKITIQYIFLSILLITIVINIFTLQINNDLVYIVSFTL